MTYSLLNLRVIFALLLLLASFCASAAPFLYADPAPTGSGVDTARYTVNGGSPVTCQLEPAGGSVRPKCDLAQLTSPADYTLVLTWCSPGGIVNTAVGATNTQAGCASSAPFAYRLLAPAVPGPTLSVAP